MLIGAILTSVNYRMFFASFDYQSIIEHNVVLTENPEYHTGGVRGTPSWWFRTVDQTFQLNKNNPNNISKKEINQIKKGDSLILFSYQYYSISSFIDFLNGRTSIFGIKSKNLTKFDPILIQNHIREMDVKGFWGFNIFLIFTLMFMYSDWLKQKFNTSNTRLAQEPESGERKTNN